MTAPTDLIERARGLISDTGALPSQNQVKAALKVGAPKAREVLAELERMAAEQRAARRPRKLRTGRGPIRIRHLRTLPAKFEVDLATVDTTPAAEVVAEPVPQVIAPVGAPVPVVDVEPVAASEPGTEPRRHVARWPILVLALPAFVAIWGGWVGIGTVTGFGEVNLLPGIVADHGWATLDTRITLPIGMEVYGAYALRVWLSGAAVTDRARRFAKWSAIGALALGAGGQIAYHLMAAAHITAAPWWITTAVSCIPVGVLGMGAALIHLIRSDQD